MAQVIFTHFRDAIGHFRTDMRIIYKNGEIIVDAENILPGSEEYHRQLFQASQIQDVTMNLSAPYFK